MHTGSLCFRIQTPRGSSFCLEVDLLAQRPRPVDGARPRDGGRVHRRVVDGLRVDDVLLRGEVVLQRHVRAEVVLADHVPVGRRGGGVGAQEGVVARRGRVAGLGGQDRVVLPKEEKRKEQMR